MKDNLLFDVLVWLINWKQLGIELLLLLVIVSALAVALSAHMTRQMFASLQSIELQSDELESEYEKLLLEQSAFADYTRIDQVSRNKLHMRAPEFSNIVIVER